MSELVTAEPKQIIQTFLKPIVSPRELIEYQKEVTQLVKEGLESGVDYGIIPGTDKPTLLKPGAERLCRAFGVAPRFEIIEKETDHERAIVWTKRKKIWNNKFKGDRSFTWSDEQGTSLGLYSYVVRCLLETGDGRNVGQGLGSCSTLETKYVDRPRDCQNTVLKMAKKRAFVDAAITAFGLSNRFTQDIEEAHEDAAKSESPALSENERRADPPKKRDIGKELKVEVYTGTTEQQEKIRAHCLKENIAETFWADIDANLMHKPFTPLAVGKAIHAAGAI